MAGKEAFEYRTQIADALRVAGWTVTAFPVVGESKFHLIASQPGGSQFAIRVRTSKQGNPEGAFKLFSHNECEEAIDEAKASGRCAKWIVVWDRSASSRGIQVTLGDLANLRIANTGMGHVSVRTNAEGVITVPFEFQTSL